MLQSGSSLLFSVHELLVFFSGFTGFHPDDQLTLVKAGAMEAILISYHHLLDLEMNSIYFPSVDGVLTRQGLIAFSRDEKFADLWFSFAQVRDSNANLKLYGMRNDGQTDKSCLRNRRDECVMKKVPIVY